MPSLEDSLIPGKSHGPIFQTLTLQPFPHSDLSISSLWHLLLRCLVKTLVAKSRVEPLPRFTSY